MAWTLLTEVYGLPKDRLYVTYFGGDEKQGLSPDLEAKELWLQVGVPENRILPGSAKDNFWGKATLYDRVLLLCSSSRSPSRVTY